MVLGLQPTSAKSYISLHPESGFRDPPLWGLETHLCQWRSRRSSLGCGGIHISPLKNSVLKAQCKEALNLIRVVAHLKWGGDRDTLLMLYRAIVHSKLDYGCIVYGTASNANLRQLDSIHNSVLRLALGAFCTSPVSSLYTETNEAPLEERRLKLSMHYYITTLLHWKLVHASTIQHVMPCMNLIKRPEIYISPGQIGEGAWHDHLPIPLISR